MLPQRDTGRHMFWTSVKDLSAEDSGMDVKLYSATDISAEGPGKGYNFDIRYGCFRGGIRVDICFGHPSRKFPRRTPEWMSNYIPPQIFPRRGPERVIIRIYVTDASAEGSGQKYVLHIL